jgi:hypothetical protein
LSDFLLGSSQAFFKCNDYLLVHITWLIWGSVGDKDLYT